MRMMQSASFDDEPTIEIPRQTIRVEIYGEDPEPKDMGINCLPRDERWDDDTEVEDISDGIPVSFGMRDTERAVL